MDKNIGQALLEEVLNKLAERRKQQEEYITTTLLERDEYAQRVGHIRAINEIEEDFKQLHRAFFPST